MKRLIFVRHSLFCRGLFSFPAAAGRWRRTSGRHRRHRSSTKQDSAVFKVAHPEQFPLATAGEHKAAPELTVTGVVNPDVSRSVPAISLASGRAVEIKARLGDTVKKGQLLMRVRSADISGAFADYRQAVADEALAKAQLERAKILYEKGAIAKKDLEVAVDVEEQSQGHPRGRHRDAPDPGRYGPRSPSRAGSSTSTPPSRASSSSRT